MNDEHQHGQADGEPTQPVGPLPPAAAHDPAGSWQSPAPHDAPADRSTPPSWVPPQQQPAPYREPWGGYPAPGTTPFPVGGFAGQPAQPGAHPGQPHARHATTKGRVSGWVWPVVAVLALVVGVLGGVAGSVGYENLRSDDTPGTVADGLAGVDTVTEAPLAAEDGTVAAVADALLPSTVQIVAEFEGQDGGATGSGFVLDRQGHIVTNNHVVADAADDGGPIEIVDQDGNRYDATVVGRSPVYDLAVLVSEEATGLEPASLGASGKLRVGETVVAFGSPLGLSSTVTAGIVSALQRPVTTGQSADQSSYINAVQTDAAINPGNSGGPLVNLLGQVVGVNSAIATTGGGLGGESGNIGVGFAIPVEQVRITADQILRTGEASYPVIGAEVQTGGQGGDGAEISRVVADGAAAEAGLEEGDVVTAVDGERVTDGIALIVSIRSNQPGETIELTVQRGGEERQVDVVLRSEVG